MATPRAVRRQADEATRLLKAVTVPNKEGEASDTGEATDTTETVENAEPAPEPAREEAPPVEPEAPAQPPVDIWEQRYKAIQGKYNAEVPRLSDELRQLRAELAELKRQPPTTAAPAPSTGSTNRLVTDDEIEEYGTDFIDLIRRAAAEAVDKKFGELTPRLSKLEASLTQTAQQSAQERVHSALDSQVENWRDINRDPLFGEWLQETDPASGLSRAQLMNEAYSKGEAARVVFFFKAFAETLPTKAALQTNTGAANERNTGKATGVRLEDIAGPPQRHPGAPPSTGDAPKSFTRAEIDEFYADVRRGKYRNRPEEKVRREAEFHRAAAEGRIV